MITYTVYVSEYYENEKCARAIATGLSLPEAMEVIKLREDSGDASADMCTDEEWMSWDSDDFDDEEDRTYKEREYDEWAYNNALLYSRCIMLDTLISN